MVELKKYVHGDIEDAMAFDIKSMVLNREE